MSKNQFERSYRDTVPPREGLQREFSQRTKLLRSAGKISMACDHCGMSYETYACWAKRTNHHYCSKSCSNEAKRIQIEKQCVVCGKTYITNPSKETRIVTCSRECLRENRRRFLLNEAQNMGRSPVFNYGNHEKGVDNAHKASEDDVRAIRKDTRSYRKVAIDYGLSPSNVGCIKRRETWSHLND